MNGMTPTRKVTAGALGGALATIAIWITEVASTLSVPGPVGAAITVVFTFAVSWFVKE
jgi:hypothetical protein